jgi:hypothetical protein
MAVHHDPIPALRIDRPMSGDRSRHRRRALIVTAILAIASVGMLADLVLVGHTDGERMWGPIVAALSALVAVAALVSIAIGSRGRFTRLVLYALFVLVAVAGVAGFNDHRRAGAGEAVGSRGAPPLAPLVFTGFGIAGALALRFGSKEN